jgi:oxygen-independent coproporphyrinogen III oxidase
MAGVYIHIPFCRQACTYCNFHFSTSLRLVDTVGEALLKELALREDYLQGVPVETIYIGGGTPSLLPVDYIKKLIDTIRKYYRVETLKEVTLEANPDDLTPQYLRALRGTEVDQADYAIKASQDAGLDNLSIDLIYGIPGLGDTAWQEHIARVAALQIPHLSCYALTVEERTALHHMVKSKQIAPIDAEQAAGQLYLLMEMADRLGYEHYEISNFSLPGKYAIHNSNYWSGATYMGIGPSAHSYDGSSRQWNIANNALYAANILERGEVVHEKEHLTRAQRINEYIMTSLRTKWGCSLEHITAVGGGEIMEEIESNAKSFIAKGWMTLQDSKLILTTDGKLFADRIAAELFVDET